MVFCVASFSRLPICRTEWQGFFFLFFFLALFPQIFLYLAALFLMAAACSRMAETNHLAGGIQKKEYFCFGVRYFFALILLLWGILLESYVNPWFLAKIL